MKTLGIWNEYMKCYDFLNDVESYKQNLDDIAEALGDCNGARILDAGSGTGNLCLELKRRGARVTGCDFSSSAIAQHREKDPEADVIEASLEDALPFATGSFDHVCCASVLLTLSEAGCHTALHEFHRVLRRGGSVVVTTAAPNSRVASLAAMHFSGLRRRHGWLKACYCSMSRLPALLRVMRYSRMISSLPDWQGFHRFSERELRDFLTFAGFSEIEVRRTYGGCFFLAKGVKRKPW